MKKELMYDVILRPAVTEKATMASENDQIVFNVASWANKTQIKEAVEVLFEVKVAAIQTLNRKGKIKVFKGVKGKKNDEKKAIVRLEEGYTIDVTTGLKG